MQAQYRQIDDDTISIFIPMQIKKRGGATMVILPTNSPQTSKINHDHKLIKAFSKAHKWQ